MVAMVTDPSAATTSPSSAPQAARPAIATRPRATSPVWNFVLNSFIFSSLGPPERGWKTTVLQVTTLSIGDTNLVLRSCKVRNSRRRGKVARPQIRTVDCLAGTTFHCHPDRGDPREPRRVRRPPRPPRTRRLRSEEPTSELQSLMRISYAVFCLKKKTNTHLPQSIKQTIN